MFKVRVIPCLDVKDGRVVKGINFVNLRDAGDPVEAAIAYDAAGADGPWRYGRPNLRHRVADDPVLRQAVDRRSIAEDTRIDVSDAAEVHGAGDTIDDRDRKRRAPRAAHRRVERHFKLFGRQAQAHDPVTQRKSLMQTLRRRA